MNKIDHWLMVPDIEGDYIMDFMGERSLVRIKFKDGIFYDELTGNVLPRRNRKYARLDYEA